ncbi:MAG: thioredoxin domain-containing protein [Verrucomicrobiota bacterium JB023]|nr:thioredoxin domain-containing protein [Verrucomicrobiota bacterium JB023]
MVSEEPKHSNRLIDEKSPYLRQHAHNPVIWYPWGREAFEKAEEEGKPILLSIGYSTCHWCHVMERESFANEEAAAYLNEHFVAIKLDREERPDLDSIYMKSFQALMGEGGGWPLNVFLTPDRKMFFGGTYFPPRPAGGRASFRQVLEGVQRAWAEKREEVEQTGTRLHEELGRILSEGSGSTESLTMAEVEAARRSLLENLDEKHGGWGPGPKFPQPSHLYLLLSSGDEMEREAALMTCRRMARGGIHDQLGGGFHRYAVDRIWLVPHFEKMLYDQAQLLECYLLAWQLTEEPLFAEVAKGIGDFVIGKMQSPGGGYYSARDAQSEGKEGKYWCWTTAELASFLDANERVVVERVFGMSEQGNFHDFSDPEPLPNLNVLSLVEQPGEDSDRFEQAVAKMRERREQRAEPMTDEKVLASWNGMMIASMAAAGRILDEPRYLDSAVRAWDFVMNHLCEGATLHNRWLEDDVETSQHSLNYFAMAKAGRQLYSSLLEVSYLEKGLQLMEQAVARFHDDRLGGFYDAKEREDLVMMLKEDTDHAIPAAGSLGVGELLRYAEMTGREDFAEVAEKTLAYHGDALRHQAGTLPLMTRGLELARQPVSRLVLAGEGEERGEFLRVAWRDGGADLLIMGSRGPVDDFSRTLDQSEGVVAYLCEGQSCREPTSEAAQLQEMLREREPAG